MGQRCSSWIKACALSGSVGRWHPLPTCTDQQAEGAGISLVGIWQSRRDGWLLHESKDLAEESTWAEILEQMGLDHIRLIEPERALDDFSDCAIDFR